MFLSPFTLGKEHQRTKIELPKRIMDTSYKEMSKGQKKPFRIESGGFRHTFYSRWPNGRAKARILAYEPVWQSWKDSVFLQAWVIPPDKDMEWLSRRYRDIGEHFPNLSQLKDSLITGTLSGRRAQLRIVWKK